MATLKAIYSLLLSDLQVVSSIRPTPVATFYRGPCGMAQLWVPTQFCNPAHERVANHLAGLWEKHL